MNLASCHYRLLLPIRILKERNVFANVRLCEHVYYMSCRNFVADVRHWCRVLIKNPGFALVTVAALALGIGANAAIFSVIERVLLRPLPFPESERVSSFGATFRKATARPSRFPST